MTPKQYLWQIRTEKERIDDLVKARDELISTMQMISSPSLEERVQTSPRDRMPEYAARLDNFDREIQRRYDKYQKFVLTVCHQIDTMTGTTHDTEQSERHILYMRYVMCADWPVLVASIPYSKSRIYQLHGTALQTFAKQYPLIRL